jgi:hypothetical protein
MELGTEVRKHKIGDIMSDWLEKFKKKLSDIDIDDNTIMKTTTANAPWMGTVTATVPSGAQPPVYNITNAGPFTGTIVGSGVAGAAFGFQQSSSVIRLHDTNNKEIVRLNNDGTVQWNKGIEIDEAAEAFSKSLTLGAEMHIGISKRVKQNMRDSVFEDLISIAKEKGSLSAEDLTYLLEASKIIEKLKGGKNDS